MILYDSMKFTIIRFSALALIFLAAHATSSLADPSGENLITLDRSAYDALLISRRVKLLEDTENSSIDDIVKGRFDSKFYESEKDYPTWGQTKATIWVRIDFYNPGAGTRLLLLENRYPFIDYLTLYSPAIDGSYSSITLGDHVAFNKRPVRHRFPVFELSVPPGQSTFFLSVRTEGLTTLTLFLWSQKNFYHYAMMEYVALGILFGFIIVMLGYNFFLYISFFTKDYLFYILYILSLMWSQSTIHGVELYLAPDVDYNWFMNQGYLLAINFTSLTALLFARAFLNFDPKYRKIHFTMKLWLLPLTVNGLVLYFNDYMIGTRLTELCTVIMMPIIIMLGIIRAFQGYKPAIFYVIGWFTILTGTFATALKIAGVIPSHYLLEWIPLTGGAIEVVILSLALGYRVNLIRAEARRQIQKLNEQLTLHIEHVETLVQERTETIKTILDHVDSGFLLIERSRKVQPGYSRSCERFFGDEIKNGPDISDILNLAGHNRAVFEAAIDQVFDDALPVEVTLRQIPRNHKVRDRMLTICASVVRNNENAVRALLITIIDETDLYLAQLETRNNATLLHILKHAQAFRTFCRDFVEQIGLMREYIRKGRNIELRIALHTLKGNASSFFLDDLNLRINQAENRDVIAQGDIDGIESVFNKFLNVNASSIHWAVERHEKSYNVTEDSIINLFKKSIEHISIEGFREWLVGWLYFIQTRPVSEFIAPVKDSAYRIAEKLNKKMTFEITGENIRVNPDHMSDILNNLVHLIRNAIDHGIIFKSSADTDLADGIVRLQFVDNYESIVIRVEDNGRGIDVEKLSRKAVEKGLITQRMLDGMSAGERMNLVFLEGLSTKEVKTAISGHGLGLSAVKRAVEARNGRISICPVVGGGVCFELDIPKYNPSVAFFKHAELKSAG
ncbi:MAG: hypothetical protein HQK54_04590 [Oligoflexales bacterium]|nr:hypothetical protein [Oligoflexales bacterium]